MTIEKVSGLALKDIQSSHEANMLPTPHKKHFCGESVLSRIETVRTRTADCDPSTKRLISFSSQCAYIHPIAVNFRRNSCIRMMWVDRALCSNLKFLCFTAGNDDCNEFVDQVA